ncbi:hypothetical protein QP028_05020 [Corynebacterium suedekumii]|nr:hypothetical protein QP028_05020 [Corynebacterium suedekumii]
MKWFPDRPGLATGLAIMGFGGGAPHRQPRLQLAHGLLRWRFRDHRAGQRSAADIPHPGHPLPGRHRPRCLRHPAAAPGLAAEAGTTTRSAVDKPMQTKGSVSADRAIRTPQFWLLWVVLFTNVTAGIGILENAAPMISDYFPHIAAGAAAGFVGLLSLTNMGGRFVWSTVSDWIGRKNIYMIYLGVGLLMYSDDRHPRCLVDGRLRSRGAGHPVVLRWRLRHHPGVPA